MILHSNDTHYRIFGKRMETAEPADQPGLNTKDPHRRSGSASYELAVLLVVVVILLIWLFLPFVHIKAASDQIVTTKNRITKVVQAQLQYEKEVGYFPNNENQLSWRVHLLPFLGYQELYDLFKLDEPWDGPNNIKLLPLMPDVYRSEGVLAELGKGETLFLRPVGNGAFPESEQSVTNMEMIMDGPAETIFLVEANPELAVPWTKPADYRFDPNDVRKGLGETRGSRIYAGMGNATVWNLTSSVGSKTIRARFTIADQDPSY